MCKKVLPAFRWSDRLYESVLITKVNIKSNLSLLLKLTLAFVIPQSVDSQYIISYVQKNVLQHKIFRQQQFFDYFLAQYRKNRIGLGCFRCTWSSLISSA